MIFTNKLKGLSLGLFASLLWASYYPAARFIFGKDADGCDPLLLSWIRFTVSALFFLPFVLGDAGRRRAFMPMLAKDWRALLGLTLSGVLIQGVLVFVACKYTTAARGSLMANASPIFTVVAAWLWLREKISRGMLAGMFIGFAGICLAMVSRSSDIFMDTNVSTLFGDLLALLSGAAWAVYTVAGVRVVKTYDSLSVTMFTFLAGSLMMPAVMLAFGSSFDFSAVTPLVWAGMLYMGIFTGGVAFMAWLMALRYVPSSMLGAYGYLSALLAAFLSGVLLHEKFSGLFVVSAVMALGGMAMMMRGGKKAKARPFPQTCEKNRKFSVFRGCKSTGKVYIKQK